MSDPAVTTKPRKKRRRPALSCEQCRQRKIKCDRNHPCTQCLQSSTPTCTYSDDLRFARGNAGSGQALSLNAGLDVLIPNRSKNPPSIASTHLSSAGVSPLGPSRSDSTQLSSWGSPANVIHHEDMPDQRVLLDRIQKLEDIIASYNETEPRASSKTTQQIKPKTELRGTVSKTRFFGQSHWMYSHGVFDKIAVLAINIRDTPRSLDNELVSSEGGRQVAELMDKCKALARRVKSVSLSHYTSTPNFREMVPSRELCDVFVENYFRTSEDLYRVLHIPTFQSEYIQFWEQGTGGTVFILKLLLVMATGVCFYQSSDFRYYRQQAIKWIYAAQSWLGSPSEKARLNMSGLQIYCLLLIARQLNSVAGDLVWISTGALLRTAIQMGFHQDPKFLPKMPVLQAEMRRRLWATILELNIQFAFDSGMPPMISLNDFNTEPPANIDDNEISERTNTPLTDKPYGVFTQTSLQLALLSALGCRLQILQLFNNFSVEPSYDHILALGSEITKLLKENNSLIAKINRSQDPGSHISQLQHNLVDLHLRRFLLIIHRLFAVKAQDDPRYYFSRKVSLDCAVTMLSYPSSNSGSPRTEPGLKDDYTLLKSTASGYFKTTLVHSSLVIFAELSIQLEEDSSLTKQSRAAREPLKEIMREIVKLSADRLTVVENNVKCHLFTSVILAQIEALDNGTNPEAAVLEAAKNSAMLCYDLLQSRIPHDQQTNEEIPPEQEETSAIRTQDFDMVFAGAGPDWILDDDVPDSWIFSSFENGTWRYL